MKIETRTVTIRELTSLYTNDPATGRVSALAGNLDIRPAYQREFIYSDKQRNAVITTVLAGFPLNTMYWVQRDDGTYEVLDGQQRTLSLCQYVDGAFAHNDKHFYNLTVDVQDAILNYAVPVYVCTGTPTEKLEWFKCINIAGAALTDQELRNASYTGPWLASAKADFSRLNGPSHGLAATHLKGAAIRQEHLETALEWIANAQGLDSIEHYMGLHQHDANANELWAYFQTVIDWANRVFPNYTREMKGLQWGLFYNTHKNKTLDPRELAERVRGLMADDEVTRKAGIYEYLLTGEAKYLSLRTFSDSVRRTVYEKQAGVCPSCGGHFEFSSMQADHVTPWSRGGKTDIDNCQMLCGPCNSRKSDR
jgi:hypothetical protein